MNSLGNAHVSCFCDENLERVAFPVGGLGSGMICVEGSGSFSQVSLRHRPDVFFEPILFSAVAVKDSAGGRARVLAGSVPKWKMMFPWGKEFASGGDGGRGKIYGFPRFENAEFSARFPFGEVALSDPAFPLGVTMTAWNPFVPNDPDASSLPVAGIEYCFSNTTDGPIEAVFSFHAENFMAMGRAGEPGGGGRVVRTDGGFVLEQSGSAERPWDEGHFAVWLDEDGVSVNPGWFRGGWFDSVTMVWRAVRDGAVIDQPEATGEPSRGGSLFLPLTLAAGEEKRVTLKWAWYVPASSLRVDSKEYYRPWYATAFSGIGAVKAYWSGNYAELRARTRAFTEAFYDSTLPAEVTEAVAANLSILKSPTVLRQHDGRLWAWEGCHDDAGSCPGTCTHVWGYAQALPHLFPALERGLRETELFESQDAAGHQNFRTTLPIGPTVNHGHHAAADGQLGGIIKVYREWRIAGDTEWIRRLWPQVKSSLDYCIETWDPARRGLPIEPHHNTYDIEFWGEDGMVGSIYLGALMAAVEMGKALGADVTCYDRLLETGRARIGERLFNGEYFEQAVQWEGLRAKDPAHAVGINLNYAPEAKALLEKEGPKYQYGSGCLSDGVIGAWMGWAAGLPAFMDEDKVVRHLEAVYRHNFKADLWEHANPQRPTYAFGHEAGLVLCTWPRGGRLSLPLPYSEEVWTGIEYQVASHLIAAGRVDEGLTIVRAVRARYDGRLRNPFNEFECGHWYARAMASYALLHAFTGARYDAVEKTLYLRPRVTGDFRSFLCTATGFGTVGVKDGKPFLDLRSGAIEVRRIDYRS